MKEYPLTTLERKAWIFAEKAHRGTFRRFTEVPYFDAHVRFVFKLLKKIDTDEKSAVAALLHDTVEDVKWVTLDIILEEFGKEVHDLVWELTSIDELVKKMGKPEYLLDKMLTMSDKGLLIKLCDRYQNLSDHFNASDRFREKYYLETQHIIKGLRSRHLNKKHRVVLSWIEGIMKTMQKRYSLLEYQDFVLSKY